LPDMGNGGEKETHIMAKIKKKFQVMIFGKAGCDKCAVLEKRVDGLLKKPEWEEFEKVKMDVESEDGLVEFCQCECVNPQRIPAFVIKRWDEETGRYELVRNANPQPRDEVCGNSILYTFTGVQTDYTDEGKGIISPKMIKSVLEQARLSA
jgi:hypothetical protein